MIYSEPASGRAGVVDSSREPIQRQSEDRAPNGHPSPPWGNPSLRVSVVIPALNEEACLPSVLPLLPKWLHEVLLVDGNSTDDTVGLARRLLPDIRIVKQEGRGKGAALRTGLSQATGDIIVMLDADGSADGGEIQKFIDVLLTGADFAKGSRFLPGGGSGDLTRIRSLGNQALTGIVNLICQTRFSDLCYGYNAFWRDCLQFIDVDVSGFEVETRLMMMVATAGLAMPSQTNGNSSSQAQIV